MATDPEVIRRLRALEHELERLKAQDTITGGYSFWTPTFTGSTGNPTVTYSLQLGVSQRIGNAITISFALTLTAASGGSGVLRLSGLPYTVGSTQDYRGGFSLVYTTGWAGTPPTSVIPETSQTYGTFFIASTGATLTPADLTASTWVYGFGLYFSS